jgi:hypothetical protein
MRTKLRVIALVIALVVLAFWFFGGPNLGWTKTRVAHIEKDPVTEIETPIYENRFVPGIDFLAKGLGVAVVLGVASFFFRKSESNAKARLDVTAAPPVGKK